MPPRSHFTYLERDPFNAAHEYSSVRALFSACECALRVSFGSVEDGFATSWLVSACPRGRPYDGIVRSDAIDVDSYLTQVPEGRRAVLTEIREACRRLLAGFAEAMSYGMPTYSRDGIAEIAWASQKRYISLYVMRADVLDAHRGQLAGLDVGKGCIRYRSPDAVDFTAVHSMLTAIAASRGPVC